VEFLFDNWALLLILAALGGIGYFVYRRVMRGLGPLQLTRTPPDPDEIIAAPSLPSDSFDRPDSSASTSASSDSSSKEPWSGGGGSFGGGGASGDW
jgi:uncharacterized membrane protein YgcG